MAFVDTANYASNAAFSHPTAVATYVNNCVSGSLLWAVATWADDSTPATVADSVNGAWTRAPTAGHDTVNNCWVSWFYFAGNASTGKPVVTLTTIDDDNFDHLIIGEHTGQAAGNPIDGTGSGNFAVGSATSNADTTGTWATTPDGDLLLGGIIDSAGGANTYAAGTGFSNLTVTGVPSGGLTVSKQTQTTHSGTTAVTWTGSGTDRYTAAGIAFKVSGGAGGRTTKNSRSNPLGSNLGMRRGMPMSPRASGILVPDRRIIVPVGFNNSKTELRAQ